MKQIITFLPILFGSLLLISCEFLGSSEYSGGVIQLSSTILDEQTAVEYSFRNTTDIPLFVVVSGSSTNIEKWTDSNWERMINTLPHRPGIFYFEVLPGETYDGLVDYELINALSESPSGRYRIALEILESRSQGPESTVTSTGFMVK